MVRGRDALYGHQRRLQLSRYQRSDFAERFAKLRLHASAALAKACCKTGFATTFSYLPARSRRRYSAGNARRLITDARLSLQGWASAHPCAFLQACAAGLFETLGRPPCPALAPTRSGRSL